MSRVLEVGAEITKLARLLNVDEKQLEFLRDTSPKALAKFRTRVTDKLYDQDGERLGYVAAAAKLIPVAVAARMASHAFGPTLSAALAGLLEPDRAVGIAGKLPEEFLTETAVQLDPRRAAEVVAQLPAATVANVGKALADRQDHVTAARFVGYLPEASLRPALAALGDADILKIAFVLEDKSRLADLARMAHDRFGALTQATADHGLWAEALDLLEHLDADQRAELADIAATQDEAYLTALIEHARDTQAWETLLQVTDVASPNALQRIAGVPVVSSGAVITPLARTAIDGGRWATLLPSVPYLTDAGKRAVAAVVSTLPSAEISRLATEALQRGQWDALYPIAMGLPADRRREVAALPPFDDPDVLRQILDTTARNDQWPDVLPLADALPDAGRTAVADVLGELPRGHLLAALDAAAHSEHLPVLMDIAMRQEPDGRVRILNVVAEMGRYADLAAALPAGTPDELWTHLAEVAGRMSDQVRDTVAAAAQAAGKQALFETTWPFS